MRKLIGFFVLASLLFAVPVLACDAEKVDACVSWAREQIEKLGCKIDESSFHATVEDLFMNKGCRLQGTRWYDVSSGGTVKGAVANGQNTDNYGCIQRYTPAAYLKQGGYLRTPTEALNGLLRNKQLSGCLYDSDAGTTDANVLTQPIIAKILSCECAANAPKQSSVGMQNTPSKTGGSSSLPGNTPVLQQKPKTPVHFADVQKKCSDMKNLNPTLTQDEFLVYVQKVEQENPSMSRNQLIAKLHQKAYEIDVDATYFGIRLFKHGDQDKGFENVKLLCKNEPKFVVTQQGTKIDIAHAYAGIRSDLNRGFLTRWFMRNVNTNWGDTFQTWIHWDNRYAPPDQRSGNNAGIWLGKYYQDSDNENKKLSDGFNDYFKSIDTSDVAGQADST